MPEHGRRLIQLVAWQAVRLINKQINILLDRVEKIKCILYTGNSAVLEVENKFVDDILNGRNAPSELDTNINSVRTE